MKTKKIASKENKTYFKVNVKESDAKKHETVKVSEKLTIEFFSF